MRYLLTVVAVEDDTTDPAMIEAAATDMWGELYPSDDVDPIAVTTRAAVLVDADDLRNLANALDVGALGGTEDGYVTATRITMALRAQAEVNA